MICSGPTPTARRCWKNLLRPPEAPALLLITSFRTEDAAAKPFLQSLLTKAGRRNCHELRVEEVSDDEATELMPRLDRSRHFGYRRPYRLDRQRSPRKSLLDRTALAITR